MSRETAGRCRVLLVEDEALIAMLMEDMLAEFDCEIFATVGQLDEAMAVAGTEQFDMAFIDVNLRGVPAWPLADVLRSRQGNRMNDRCRRDKEGYKHGGRSRPTEHHGGSMNALRAKRYLLTSWCSVGLDRPPC